MLKRILALLMAALLTVGAALAEGEFPMLNEAGFLDEGEFVYANEEEGVWRYAGPTLWVEIIRYTQDKPNKQVWFEAEIRSAEGEAFDVIPNATGKKRMTSLEYPYKIARKNQTVFAVSADFAHLRISQHKGAGVGIIIRDGEVISRRTYRSGTKKFPNLDTLALYPDGRMIANKSYDYNDEEYLELGATDVLAFGPWLIHEGEKNPKAKSATTEHAQRVAVGMVEPGHYWAMMLEGRTKTSKGDTVVFLMDKLYDRGVTEALNLDGGQSSSMVFMGRQICEILNEKGKPASGRKAAEILGIGTSEQVPAADSGIPMSY